MNTINPIARETPLPKSFMREDTLEMRKKKIAMTPLGRFAILTDIGNIVVFLCSNEVSMIAGVALEVDGGRWI